MIICLCYRKEREEARGECEADGARSVPISRLSPGLLPQRSIEGATWRQSIAAGLSGAVALLSFD